MLLIPIWLDHFSDIENEELRELNYLFAKKIHLQLVEAFFKSFGFHLEAKYFCKSQIPEGWDCNILEFGRYSYNYISKKNLSEKLHIWIEPHCNKKCESFLPKDAQYKNPDSLNYYKPDWNDCELSFDYEIMVNKDYQQLGKQKISLDE